MKRFLQKFIIGWLVNALAIYVIAVYVIDAVDYGDIASLLIASLAFSVVSMTVKPLLKVLSLPFPIVGLLVLVLFNALVLFGISYFMPGFTTGGIESTVMSGVAISVINFIAHLII